MLSGILGIAGPLVMLLVKAKLLSIERAEAFLRFIEGTGERQKAPAQLRSKYLEQLDRFKNPPKKEGV